MQLKDKHQFYNYNFELGVFCFSCFRTDHSVFTCPYIHFNVDREHLILKQNYSEKQIRREKFRPKPRALNSLKNRKKVESDVCKLSFEKYYESRKRNRLKDALIRLESPVEEEKENLYQFTPIETYKINDGHAPFNMQGKEGENGKYPESEISEKSEKSKDDDKGNLTNVEDPGSLSENSAKSVHKNSILNLEAHDLYTYMIYKEEIKLDNMRSFRFYFPYNNVESVLKLCSIPLMRIHLKHKKKAVKFLENVEQEKKDSSFRGVNFKSVFSKTSSFGA